MIFLLSIVFILFRTILYVSIVYALGNIVVSVTAIPSILEVVQL